MSKKTVAKSLRPALSALESAYDLAIALFPDEEQREALKQNRPIIVIQTGGRKKNTLGWHWRNRWQAGTEQPAEITVVAESLDRTFYQVITTLIHEMVHHANNLLGVEDVSSNQYHNKKFANLAEQVGLVVEKGPRGFAYTPSMQHHLYETVRGWGLDQDAFKLNRRREPKTNRPGSKLRKYTCDCGYGIRIAVKDDKVDLTCNICGSQVTEAS